MSDLLPPVGSRARSSAKSPVPATAPGPPRWTSMTMATPDDWQVEQIGLVASSRAAEWLRDVFPDLWRSLYPYSRIEVSEALDALDGPAVRMYVATGGWSGACQKSAWMLHEFQRLCGQVP